MPPSSSSSSTSSRRTRITNSILLKTGLFLVSITSLLPWIVVHTNHGIPTLSQEEDMDVITAHLQQSFRLERDKHKEEANFMKELKQSIQEGEFISANGGENEKKAPMPLLSETATAEAFTKGKEDETITDSRSQLARGVAGLPMSQTPALEGAQRGKIKCDVDANDLAYWNEPQGLRDLQFQTPFATTTTAALSKDGVGNYEEEEEEKEKYLSFEPDSGGWNNIRMSLENMFIIAAATNRTLVLPPDQPLYLLNLDTSQRYRGIADFYPIHTPTFQQRLRIITAEEFLNRTGDAKVGRFPIREDIKDKVWKGSRVCQRRAKSDISCFAVYDHFRSIGFVPRINGAKHCFVFDVDVYQGRDMTKEHSMKAKKFCPYRAMELFTADMQKYPIIHFQTSEKDYRILNHFYGFVHFTDPAIDNFYKRFVRDYMHYTDAIFCAAAKIVRSLQKEGKERGFEIDKEGGGGYSSLHVRRGDLQYPTVKIPAEEWYENTKDLWKENEILFIATDERNKTFFDPIKEHHDIRFLDDYWDVAGLGDLDPNYIGMVDTIVASRGRIFAGTHFSTFTGFITRMRGYHGMSMRDSYYGMKKFKTKLHNWKDQSGTEFAFEWPSGWIGIDGDVVPSKDIF